MPRLWEATERNVPKDVATLTLVLSDCQDAGGPRDDPHATPEDVSSHFHNATAGAG